MRMFSRTLWDPLGKTKISDHAPVSTCFALGHSVPHGARPIPAWIASTKEFAIRVDELLHAGSAWSLEPWERWRLHKDIIVSVAKQLLRSRYKHAHSDPKI